MTASEHHTASCAGKMGYKNKGDALKVVRRMNRRPGSKYAKSDLGVYRCYFCKMFHVGNH